MFISFKVGGCFFVDSPSFLKDFVYFVKKYWLRKLVYFIFKRFSLSSARRWLDDDNSSAELAYRRVISLSCCTRLVI